MTFAEKLKQTRKKQGISQAELARRVGISRAAISRYESGERTQIAAPIVMAISEILKLEPSDLVLDTENVQVYATEREADKVANRSKTDRAEALREIKKYLDCLDDCAIWDAVQRIEDMTFVPRYRRDGGVNGSR